MSYGIMPSNYQDYEEYVSKQVTEENLRKIVEKMNIGQLYPIKSRGITKSGLFSYFGFIEGEKVKVYSCFTEKQTDLRVKIGEHKFSCKFPPILARKGNVLVDQWIKGKTLDVLASPRLDLYARKVLSFMYELKDFDISSLDIESFDYLEYLKIRIKDSGIDNIDDMYQKWSTENINTKPMLCHNDLSKDNLVFNKQDLYIIDNEMLGISKGWFLSWKNSFMSQVGFSSDDFYQGISKSIIDEAWLLRKTGTKLLEDKKDWEI